MRLRVWHAGQDGAGWSLRWETPRGGFHLGSSRVWRGARAAFRWFAWARPLRRALEA